MIKIKDYIFNENDIRRIYYNKDKSCLCVGFRDEDLVTNWVENATFEDIEWNYEDEQIRKCLDSNYREEELEEEKNRIKSDYTSVKISCNVLENRINKAIEYIEENYPTSTINYQYEKDKLLKILKGEYDENKTN